jgi:hypothetical protein
MVVPVAFELASGAGRSCPWISKSGVIEQGSGVLRLATPDRP